MTSPAQAPTPTPTPIPIPIVLDTDIGSDVDDLLALAVVLGSPALDLQAVTTVYGDTRLRARLVAHALGLAGVDVPVAVGRERPRSGKDVWWAGHEGRLVPDLDTIAVDDDLDAVALLAHAGTAVAIGPLTDLAEALERPDAAVTRAVVMGANFGPDGKPEHNIASDVAAAQVVFGSGLPVEVVGVDQTTRIRVRGEALRRIAGTGPFGAYLDAEVRQYWDSTGAESNVPHDPIAVLMITDPGLFTFGRGTVTVDEAGVSAFATDPAGPHRIVTDLDEQAVANTMLDRILTACTLRSPR